VHLPAKTPLPVDFAGGAYNAAAPMDALTEARLVAGVGIEGDRDATRLGTYSKKHHIDRQVTLIEVEVLEALARDRSIELAPHEHRRNLTTRGVPLGHIVGQYFRIGDCVLYGGRLNVPTIEPCMPKANRAAHRPADASAATVLLNAEKISVAIH
jgi:MOSC domain-containing protein YiiM